MSGNRRWPQIVVTDLGPVERVAKTMATYQVHIRGDQVRSVIRLCSSPGCTNPENTKGLCFTHHRFGIDYRIGRKRNRRGKQHHRWTETPGWLAVHHRLLSYRGRAANHMCSCGCGAQALDWAFVGDTTTALLDKKTGRYYTTDLDDFTPLARKCHMAYDREMGMR